MKIVHSLFLVTILTFCSCSATSVDKSKKISKPINNNSSVGIVIKSGQVLIGQPTWVNGKLWYMTRCAYKGETPKVYYFNGQDPEHPEKGFKEVILFEQAVYGFGM